MSKHGLESTQGGESLAGCPEDGTLEGRATGPHGGVERGDAGARGGGVTDQTAGVVDMIGCDVEELELGGGLEACEGLAVAEDEAAAAGEEALDDALVQERARGDVEMKAGGAVGGAEIVAVIEFAGGEGREVGVGVPAATVEAEGEVMAVADVGGPADDLMPEESIGHGHGVAAEGHGAGARIVDARVLEDAFAGGVDGGVEGRRAGGGGGGDDGIEEAFEGVGESGRVGSRGGDESAVERVGRFAVMADERDVAGVRLALLGGDRTVMELDGIGDDGEGQGACDGESVAFEEIVEEVADEEVEGRASIADGGVEEVRHGVLDPADEGDVGRAGVAQCGAGVVGADDEVGFVAAEGLEVGACREIGVQVGLHQHMGVMAGAAERGGEIGGGMADEGGEAAGDDQHGEGLSRGEASGETFGPPGGRAIVVEGADAGMEQLESRGLGGVGDFEGVGDGPGDARIGPLRGEHSVGEDGVDASGEVFGERVERTVAQVPFDAFAGEQVVECGVAGDGEFGEAFAQSHGVGFDDMEAGRVAQMGAVRGFKGEGRGDGDAAAREGDGTGVFAGGIDELVARGAEGGGGAFESLEATGVLAEEGAVEGAEPSARAGVAFERGEGVVRQACAEADEELEGVAHGGEEGVDGNEIVGKARGGAFEFDALTGQRAAGRERGERVGGEGSQAHASEPGGDEEPQQLIVGVGGQGGLSGGERDGVRGIVSHGGEKLLAREGARRTVRNGSSGMWLGFHGEVHRRVGATAPRSRMP